MKVENLDKITEETKSDEDKKAKKGKAKNHAERRNSIVSPRDGSSDGIKKNHGQKKKKNDHKHKTDSSDSIEGESQSLDDEDEDGMENSAKNAKAEKKK